MKRSITRGALLAALLSIYAYGYNSLILEATARAEKVTICHATESEENPWVRIVVAEQATQGHFDNKGTPLAGHEDDILLPGDVACPVDENPEPTISQEPSPSVEPSDSPVCEVSEVASELVAEGETTYSVRFENTSDCEMKVGSSSYDVYEEGQLCLYPELGCQVRYDYKDIVLSAGEVRTIEVSKPEVCYQLDWYIGESIETFGNPAPCYSCEGRLLGYSVNADEASCGGGGVQPSVTPSPTAIPSATPSATPTPTDTAEPTVTPTPEAEPSVTPTATSGPTPTPGSTDDTSDNTGGSGSNDDSSSSTNDEESNGIGGPLYYPSEDGGSILGVTDYADTGVSELVILSMMQMMGLTSIGVGIIKYLTHLKRV